MISFEGISKIRILDPATVNKIAAGEVVERPASVVKELVENAIDAGAQSIRIDIGTSGNGITSIRVADDGCGMSPADALLAFAPHATSKITGIEDLHRIDTLGFRGEALASIAAVAKVTLVTRSHESGEAGGIRIVLRGGNVAERSETGAPEGTSVMVEDLFFNTPARKKFQTGKNTELIHIHAFMEGICLSHPEISFRLLVNASESLITERTKNLRDTLARIYGSGVLKDLIPVSASLPFMTLSGYISRPSLSRKDASRILVSVNKRFVVSRQITSAIKTGYGTLLPRDRFPVAFLALAISTSCVDINVHPAKKHVRISHEQEVEAAIREAVITTLLTHDVIPAVKPPVHSPIHTPDIKPDVVTATKYEHSAPAPPGVSETTHTGTVVTDRQLRQTELYCGGTPVEPTLPPLVVIGQFGGIYILAASQRGELMVIDQHAAHERILYEQVSSRSGAEQQYQELIVPVILHRTPKDAAVLRDLLPVLSDEGFVVEEFGRDTFLVRAIPVVMGKCEDASLIDDIIGDLVSTGSSGSVHNREEISRIIACRGAIKAGTVCSPEQCQRLLDQLRFAKNPYTCPHGRPTVIRFGRKDLDAMFKRI
jgi:DNA mismatch repair protein MutL